MESSFSGKGDEMPRALLGQRKKFIHQIGMHGKVKFVSNGKHDLTGIFEGADHGIVRFSSAMNPAEKKPLGPGLGLKFLRDG